MKLLRLDQSALSMSMSYIIIILFSLLQIQMINTISISFPLSFNLNVKTVAIQAMLGSNKRPVDFCIDLSSNYSLIFDLPEYNKNNSASLEISDKTGQYITIHGNISSDIVYFPQGNPNNDFQMRTQFLLLGVKTRKIKLPVAIDLSSACFSLSLSPTSLLSQLRSSKAISKSIVSLGLYELTLGDIEPAVEEKMFKCPLLKMKSQWGCNVTGIGFKKLPLDKNDTQTDTTDVNIISNHFKNYLHLNKSMNGYFSTMTNDIILPMSYQREFIDNYFGKYFFDKNCKIITIDKLQESVTCGKSVIEQLPSVSFIFNDNFGVRISSKKLFTKNRGKPRRMFRIKFMKLFDRILFGNGFIREVNLVLNDDEKYIGLASMTSKVFGFDGRYTIVNDSNVDFPMLFMGGYVVIILMLITGAFGLMYTWFSKIRNKDGKKNSSIEDLFMG